MKKIDVVHALIGNDLKINLQRASAFAPTNIALCKYWGKRHQELNLPMTLSLSISLGEKGTTTELAVIDGPNDLIFLNGQAVDPVSSFSKRLIEFLDLFRQNESMRFCVDSHSNIPIAAGLASSASGFASIVLALNKLFALSLSPQTLSILARLGSGSACRSMWNGFVEWHVGTREDGLDSHGEPIDARWPELCVGLLIVSRHEKSLSSRVAMDRTVKTSPLYSVWPQKVDADLIAIKAAIQTRDFELFGKTAESNAMTMHATMLAAWPAVNYFLPETVAAMHQIWQLRQEGLDVYFTQDAGPNLKLLFLDKDKENALSCFSNLELCNQIA